MYAPAEAHGSVHVSAAAAAPFLQSLPAEAKLDQSGRAQVMTIFHHRGCQRGGPDTEYKSATMNRIQ